MNRVVKLNKNKASKLTTRVKYFECETPGKCFAKRYDNPKRIAVCVALNSTYPAGMKCPFQKECRE